MKVVKVVILFLFFVSFRAQAAWNGVGEIQAMFIYPDYAVIVQGNTTAGPAGCANEGSWSFAWSDFDQATQNRIQSMLLSAYVSKTPIQVAIDSSGCGPEGKKKFNGMLMMP